MEFLIEGLIGAVFLLVGWLHMRQNNLEKRIDNCVEKDVMEEIKEDLKETIKLLTEVRVENAKWQGLMAKAIEKNSENS